MLKETLDVAALLREFPRVLDRLESAERRIVELERKLTAPPCPRCKLPTWAVQASAPDSVFGDLGGNKRIYRCASCGFEESRLET